MVLTTVNSGGIKDDSIVNADIKSNAAIAKSKLASLDIVNADINASAAIAGSKISPDFGSQNIATTGTLGSSTITINGTIPAINFNDTDHESDYQIRNYNGTLQFLDLDQSGGTVFLQRETNADISLTGNLNVSSGVDVTGDLTCAGKLRVDISSTGTAGSGSAEGIFLRNTNETDGNAVTIFGGADDYSAAASAINFINIDHSANAGAISFDTRTAGNAYAERMRIDALGRILTGGITADSNSFSSIVTTGGTNSNGGVQVHYNTGSYGGGSMTTANAGGGGLDFWTYTGNIGSESYSKRVSIDSGGRVTKPQTPAFLAYHQSSDLQYDVGDTLAYAYEVFDIGSNYDTSTSTFTAPVAGKYLFSANANGDHDTNVGGVPRAYWKINGSNVGNGIHLRGPDVTDQGLEQRSQTVIFNLAANDTVKIVVGQNRWDLFGANSFCGYLLG